MNDKKNKVKKYILIKLFCLFMLVLSVLYSAAKEKFFPAGKSVSTIVSASSAGKTKEMKAVWVSFMDLDLKGTDYSEKAFKEKFDNIVDDCKSLKLNALIVNVRSFGDALYPSKIFPSSHIVVEKQGDTLKFDPLKYMIEKTHSENMQFHAWINPLRIQINNRPEFLAENNPFNAWKNNMDPKTENFVVDFGNEKYYNPGYAEVRKLIINGVKEVVSNYDVDGIHFDDYFYPENKPDFDAKCYSEYLSQATPGEALPLDKWRLANINALVAGTYNAVKSIKSNVEFGISPQCNILKNAAIGADIYSWCQYKGYVDYICPQMYVNFEHWFLPFDTAMSTWKDITRNKDIKLYCGLGVYKAGSDVDRGTWKNSNDILQKEVEYARKSGCDGFMLFCYGSLKLPQSQEEVKNMMKVLNS